MKTLLEAKQKFFAGYDKPRPEGSAQSSKVVNWRHKRKPVYNFTFPKDAEEKYSKREILFRNIVNGIGHYPILEKTAKNLDRRTRRYKRIRRMIAIRRDAEMMNLGLYANIGESRNKNNVKWIK